MKNAFISIAALAALSLSAFTAIADEPELVEVIAIGAGMTQDEAHKAADKAAVEQVVGTIIDATTLVENDELVEDKILTYSAALIADSKIIGTPKKGANGLITLKVKATVKKTALKEKLTAAKIVSVAIDGESLWAQAVSAQDNLANAEAMIKDVLAKHITCVVAEPVPGKTGKSPLDYDPKTGEVFANVRVHVDYEKYRQFVTELLGKLTPMAERKLSYQARNSLSEHFKDPYPYYFAPPSFSGRLLDTKNVFVIVENMRSLQTTILIFDDNKFAVIEAQCEPRVALQISLLDRSRDALSTKIHPLTHGEQNLSVLARTYRRIGYPCGCLPFCCGYFDYDGQMVDAFGWDPWTDRVLRIPLGTFTPDELKTVGKLEIKLGHMKNGQFTEE